MPSFYIAFPLSFFSFLSSCPSLSFYSPSSSIQYSSNNFILARKNISWLYIWSICFMNIFSKSSKFYVVNCYPPYFDLNEVVPDAAGRRSNHISAGTTPQGLLLWYLHQSYSVQMCEKNAGLINLEISDSWLFINRKKVLKALKWNNRKNGWKLKFESNFF